MIDKKWKNFIKKSRRRYGIMRHIRCPAFNYEMIHFTDKGFKHLMYKNGIPRSKNEQAKRMRLIPRARIILEKSNEYNEFREIRQMNSIIRFWAFEQIVGTKSIRVVVRQINTEPRHFFSVMSGKRHKSTKNP
jgi:hypothetical protein